MNHTEISAALDWRYATKKFDPNKKIGASDWKSLEESLVKAPSSYGLQPFKIIVVENPQLKAQLKSAAYNQPQVADCSHYLVFTYKKKIDADYVQNYIKRISETRGMPPDALNGFRDVMIGDVVNGPRAPAIHVWTQRQAYIALGFLLETAALLKIDACPMEGFDTAQFDRVLGLENSGYASVVSAALGYRHPEDTLSRAVKVRMKNMELIEYK